MLINNPREGIEALLGQEPVPEEDRIYYLTSKEFDSPEPRARVLGEIGIEIFKKEAF